MYSQDPDVRRRKVKLRYFSYGVMTLLVAAAATLSILYVQGFRLNTQLEVHQGGLVKFDSQPRDAVVTVDGKRIEQTPYQTNLTAGQHTINYARDQYRPWQKTVDVRAGQVLWLNYPRLLPNTITTEPISSRPALHQASAATNREWMLLLPTPEGRTFTLVNITDERNIREESVELPVAAISLAAAPGEVFSVLAWSADARQVLLKHTVGNAVEFILLPLAEPTDAVNLGILTGLPLTEVTFAPNAGTLFFARTADGKLYRLSSESKDETLLIAEDVSVYEAVSADTLAYASTSVAASAEAKPARALNIWQRGNEQPMTLRALPAEGPVQLAYAGYLTRSYLAVAVNNTFDIIENPLSQQKKTLLNAPLAFTPSQFRFSPNHRFVAAWQGSALKIYDLELGKLSDVTLPADMQGLQWADDHHLAFSTEGTLHLMEFDGTNNEAITAVASGFNVLLGSDGEVLLSIGKNESSGAFVLQRSALVRQQDLPFLRV